MKEAKKLGKNIQQEALPMQRELQMLTAKLDLPLRFDQIPLLRGAIVEAAGRELDLLHNHQVAKAKPIEKLEDKSSENTKVEGRTSEFIPSNKYHYRYPLVQYRVHRGRAMLVGYNEGAETLRETLLKVRSIQLGSVEVPLRLYQLQEQAYTLKILPNYRVYRLHHWLALNEENYRKWQQLDKLSDRVLLLEQALNGQLLAFAKNMGWRPTDRLEVHLVDMIQHRVVRHRNTPLMAFDVEYRVNADLPPLIALGRATSHGFGWQIPFRKKK